MITENYTGAYLTGDDGEENRTLTINNQSLTSYNGFILSLDGLTLSNFTQYYITHQSSNSIITFLVPVFDTQLIVVNYNTVISGDSSLDLSGLGIPLQQIYNTINRFGDTVILRVMTRTFSTDYNDESETYEDSLVKAVSSNLNDSYYNQSDREVKMGIFNSSDKRFYFKSNQTGLELDNQIQHQSIWYRIKDVNILSLGDTVYAIEVVGSRI